MDELGTSGIISGLALLIATMAPRRERAAARRRRAARAGGRGRWVGSGWRRWCCPVAQLAEVEGVAVGGPSAIVRPALGLAQELAGALVDGIAAELEGASKARSMRRSNQLSCPIVKSHGEHEHHERRQQRQATNRARRRARNRAPGWRLAQIAIQAPDLYSVSPRRAPVPAWMASRMAYSSPSAPHRGCIAQKDQRGEQQQVSAIPRPVSRASAGQKEKKT